MKKASIILVIITLVFAGFAGGFFLGRNFSPAPVTVSDVPTEGSSPASTTASEQSVPISNAPEPSGVTGLIDINTADHSRLCSLPGIGDVLAQRIISYREQNGPFSSVAQLNEVEGIGDKKLEAILDLVTVGGGV